MTAKKLANLQNMFDTLKSPALSKARVERNEQRIFLVAFTMILTLKKIHSRWQAAAAHFLISFAIFIPILYTITTNWYPDGYFGLAGLKAIALIVGVDLILGPLLTLIVFNRKKKSLPFDLALIGLVQFAALIFGISTIYQARPIIQIQSYDKVFALTREETQPFGIPNDTIERYGKAPIRVFLDLPKDIDSIRQIEMITSYVEGKHLISRHDLYRVYSQRPELLKTGTTSQEPCAKTTLVYLGIENQICLNLKDGNFRLVSDSSKMFERTSNNQRLINIP